MKVLRVSRQSVYTYAERERWHTIKVGLTRLYLHEDVQRHASQQQKSQK